MGSQGMIAMVTMVGGNATGAASACQHPARMMRAAPDQCSGEPPLELEAGHGLRGWAVRHRRLSLAELTAPADGSAAGSR